MIDVGDIRPETLAKYRRLAFEAQQYEKHYKTIDSLREKQLTPYIRDVMNKLRKDTFDTLANELFEFLNGKEKLVGSQSVRISSEDGKKLS